LNNDQCNKTVASSANVASGVTMSTTATSSSNSKSIGLNKKQSKSFSSATSISSVSSSHKKEFLILKIQLDKTVSQVK
jgi:hypothetical protein